MRIMSSLENLEQALNAIFGGRRTAPNLVGHSTSTHRFSIQDIAKRGRTGFEHAKSLQKQG